VGLEIVREYAAYRQREDLLTEVQPFPVEDFYQFYLRERFRLVPGAGELPFGMEGVTYPNGQMLLAPSVYEGLLDGEPRARMTAAHEAVHGVVHLEHLQQAAWQSTSGSAPALYRRNELPPYADPEWQARRIASTVLMPWPLVKRLLEKHGASVEALKAAFNVSTSAAEVRLNILRDKLHRI
jgi:hypothetical protein